MSPDDPRHGRNAGYVHGCRCVPCRVAHSEESRLRRLHPRPLLDAAGTHRRIQGLHRLGWTGAEISRRAGRTQFWSQQVLLQDRVQQATADTIRSVYDDLSMTWSTSTWAARASAEARAKGWPPPLAWDDDEIDDPTAVPYADHDITDLDQVVVQRVLAGEWTLPTTKPEKVEVVRRWRAAGHPVNELRRLTGWKPERYYTPGEAA